jgi:hypothetical protein
MDTPSKPSSCDDDQENLFDVYRESLGVSGSSDKVWEFIYDCCCRECFQTKLAVLFEATAASPNLPQGWRIPAMQYTMGLTTQSFLDFYSRLQGCI